MSEKHTHNSVVKLSHSTVVYREDGIMELECGADTYYEMTHLKELLEVYKKLFGEKKVPMLHVVGPYTSIAPEARSWGASKEATQFSLAEAFVLKSLAQKLLANFYVKFDKPEVPTKFFTTIPEAEQWLKSFL